LFQVISLIYRPNYIISEYREGADYERLLTCNALNEYNFKAFKFWKRRYNFSMITCRRLLVSLVFALSLLLPGLLALFDSPAACAADAMVISPTTATEAYENEPFNWQLPVSGGTAPYSANVTGLLPSWLTLNQATLTLSGKPPKGLTTDNVSFGVRIADSSNPQVLLDTRISIPLRYHSNISVGSALSEGQANVYTDGQQADRLAGGGKLTKSFNSGTSHIIAVERQITGAGNNVRFTAINDKITVNGLSPDAAFDYAAEYNIQVKTNVEGMPALLGSGWYKAGSTVGTTALNQYEPKTGVQYRFSYWQLPTGEVSGNTILDLKVTKQGDALAVYDTYYQLSFNTQYCTVNGAGWYKAGTTVKWNIACTETIPSPDFWGSLGVELKPNKTTGTVVMDAPREIEMTWKPDYTRLIVTVTLGAIGAILTVVATIAHDKVKQWISRMRGGGY
jgi:hypothetical protein